MTAVIDAPARSPIGSTSEEAAARRRRRSAAREAEGSRLAAYRSIAATVIHGRGVRGWTQRRPAEEIGTTHTVVSWIENGRHAVSGGWVDQRDHWAAEHQIAYERGLPT